MPAVVNTELGSGLTETRAIKVLEPEDVADAIVGALEQPKFDVFVPRERDLDDREPRTVRCVDAERVESA